jgi:hypothetical protein
LGTTFSCLKKQTAGTVPAKPETVNPRNVKTL